MWRLLFSHSVTLTFRPDITDVCLDESAVSSDPLLAFLLDEVVIKDWCKRAVNALISEIGMICIHQHLINGSSSNWRFLCLFMSLASLHASTDTLVEGEVRVILILFVTP
jgi:hypothetical protein